MLPTAGAAAAIPIIKEVISSGMQYLACREQEKTKRAEIAAKLEASLTVIEKKYGGLSKLIDENHDMAMEAYKTISELIHDKNIQEDTELFKFLMHQYMDTHRLYSGNLRHFGNNIMGVYGNLNRGVNHEH